MSFLALEFAILFLKAPKDRFPSYICFLKCRREIAVSFNNFNNRWCKRKNVESYICLEGIEDPHF